MLSGTAKARVGPKPRISVVIPSRNRLTLAGYAIDSVLRQADDDVEIVVADNASSEDYAGYVQRLGDARIVYQRSDEPLSVTANWNRAINAATGDYVIMLGDDDALAPGYFERQRKLIADFDKPDVIFCLAFHYAYPGVVPGHDDGYLAYVNNSREVFADGSPALISPDVRKRLGKLGVGLRHHVSFNAQHYLYSRAFIERRKAHGPFYQSRYPDYFACFVTFIEAQHIVADSRPSVIIGISPKSFGFFLLNDKEAEGRRLFLAEAETRTAPEPETDHLSSWLEASLAAGEATHWPTPRRSILRRYARIRALNAAVDAIYPKAGPAAPPAPQGNGRIDLETLVLGWKTAGLDRTLAESTAARLIDAYDASDVDFMGIADHAVVSDAIAWLDKHPAELTSRSAFRLPPANTAKAGAPAASALVPQLQEIIKAKDAYIRQLSKNLDDTVKELQGLLRDRDRDLRAQQNHIRKQDAFIAKALADANTHADGLKAHIDTQNAFIEDAVAKAKAHVDGLQQHIQKQDAAVVEIIRAKDEHIAGLQAIIDRRA